MVELIVGILFRTSLAFFVSCGVCGCEGASLLADALIGIVLGPASRLSCRRLSIR